MSYWRFDLSDLIDEQKAATEKARKELERLGKAIAKERRK